MDETHEERVIRTIDLWISELSEESGDDASANQELAAEAAADVPPAQLRVIDSIRRILRRKAREND